VVGDLVDDRVADQPPQLVVVAGNALDVPPKQGDAVGQSAGIVIASLRQGDALIEAQEPRLAAGYPVLDEDLDVVHGFANPVG
jgi:hypothetical protein